MRKLCFVSRQQQQQQQYVCITTTRGVPPCNWMSCCLSCYCMCIWRSDRRQPFNYAFFLCSNASECIISTRFGRVIWRRCPSSCRTENATHDDLNSEAVVCCRMNDHVVQCASVFQLTPASLCSAGARHFACTKGYNLTHMCRRVYMAAYSFHHHQLCVCKLS